MKKDRNKALARAIEIIGGVGALGNGLDVTSQAVSQWNQCPVERVLAVEALTEGVVTRHQLRPDIYPADAA